MEKLMRILLLILLFLSCASNRLRYHEAFAVYVAEFEIHLGKQVNIPINFVKLDKKYAGKCWFGLRGRYIEINQVNWNDHTDLQKKQLIFHELGHCVLNLSHSPDGLMQSKMPLTHKIRENWETWVEEMFNIKEKLK